MGKVNMQNFGFFDFQAGDDDTYRYTSEEFARIYSYMIGNGVPMKSGKKLDVVSSSNTSIQLAPGAVFINGRCGWNDDRLTVPLSSTSETRRDYLVAEVNTDNRTIAINQVIGSASLPTLTDNQVPLYELNWAGGSPVVTDCRPFLYVGSNQPSAQIVYSATVPSNPVEGMVWLRPAN